MKLLAPLLVLFVLGGCSDESSDDDDKETNEAQAICDRAVNVPPAPGSGGVLIPGQPEVRNRAQRRAAGIELAESTWEAIRETAASLGAAIPA